MSEVIKVIMETVVDVIPVVFLLAFVIVLTFGGGMQQIITLLSSWMLG